MGLEQVVDNAVRQLSRVALPPVGGKNDIGEQASPLFGQGGLKGPDGNHRITKKGNPVEPQLLVVRAAPFGPKVVALVQGLRSGWVVWKVGVDGGILQRGQHKPGVFCSEGLDSKTLADEVCQDPFP